MTGEPILQLRGLTKSFGALKAVNDVDFDVPEGRIMSIIGPNGAGKSTLFNLISGTLPANGGSILFKGKDIAHLPPHRRLMLGISRSFQITNLLGALSVEENIRLACQARMSRRHFLRPVEDWDAPVAEARAILDRFDLAGMAGWRAADLSHGDQRRLEIAVCMGSRPTLLLLDEPTQGMGREETEATDRLIRSLAGETTIVLVEHDVELVMSISDRIVVMHQGRKIAEDEPAALRRNRLVQEAYLGDSAQARGGHA